MFCLSYVCIISKIQELAVMESTQVALENVVSAIFDGSHEYSGGRSEVHLALCRIFEGCSNLYLFYWNLEK